MKLTIDLPDEDIRLAAQWAGQEDSKYLDMRLGNAIKKAWEEQSPLEVVPGQIIRRLSDGKKGFVTKIFPGKIKVFDDRGDHMITVPAEGLKRSEWAIEYAG